MNVHGSVKYFLIVLGTYNKRNLQLLYIYIYTPIVEAIKGGRRGKIDKYHQFRVSVLRIRIWSDLNKIPAVSGQKESGLDLSLYILTDLIYIARLTIIFTQTPHDMSTKYAVETFCNIAGHQFSFCCKTFYINTVIFGEWDRELRNLG